MTQFSQMPDIRQLGDPILRQIATPVPLPLTPQMQQFIQQMQQWVIEANGVGLAAPQIGESLQILVIASRPNPRYPHAPHRPPFAVLNPTIIEQSLEQVQGWEGCLSVPGIRGLVPRAEWIEVRYYNSAGEIQQERFSGFIARIFQHEYDHLIGLSYLDRLRSNLDIISEQQYFKRMESQ